MGGVHLAVAHRVPLGLVSGLIFTAVAVGAAFLWRRRRSFGVAALLVLEPIGWAHDVGATQLTLSKAALAGLLVALVLERTSFSAFRDPRTRPLVGGVVAIAIVTALTAIPATYLAPVVRETLKALEYLATFAVASLAIASDDDERVLQTSVLIATTIVCASALAQYVTGAPSGTLIGGRVIPRIAGFLEGPNQLAGFLDLAIPLLLARMLARDRFRVAVAALVAVAVATDVLTLSRGGLVGAVAGAAFVFVFRVRGNALSARFVVVACALGAAIVALSARLGFLERFFTVGDVARKNGLGTRSELWHAAVALWRTDPALGVGAGNFERLLPEAGLVGVRTHANDLYLQSLAEGGVALLSAVVWTIVSAIALCARYAPQSVLLLGIGGATFAFAAHQIVDVLTFFPKVGGVWYLLIGAAAGRVAAMPVRSTP